MIKSSLVLFLLISTASIGEVSQDVDGPTRARMDAIISVFENDTPKIQYSYIEDIHDERGYTAGRAGFTTSSGDLLQVVEKYNEIKPGNPLAKFIPRLKFLAKNSSPLITGLEGMPALWKVVAKDADFRKVQDAIVDEEYYEPALEMAKKYKISTPIGILIFYDAMIQHGDGNDPDGFDSMGAFTRQLTLAQNRNLLHFLDMSTNETKREENFLKLFLQTREKVLNNPSNQGTRENWKESIVRVKFLRKLLQEGNFELKGPIHINIYGEDYDIP